MSTQHEPRYQWITSSTAQYRFLEHARQLFGSDHPIEIFFETGSEFGRIDADGIVTLTGWVGNKKIALAYSDFRVSGGSFSKKNSERLSTFIRECAKSTSAMVIALDSLGVRFTQGRTVFSPAFEVIPALYEYRKSKPVYTVSLSRCLGLASLILAQGHYRMAVTGESLINLTGPEVLSMFFGDKYNFDEFASASHQIGQNTLIHEIVDTTDQYYHRIKTLIRGDYLHESNPGRSTSSDNSPTLRRVRAETQNLLSQFDAATEIFSQLSTVVRVYRVKLDGKELGVLMNPPYHPNNLMTVGALDKCLAAMDYFKSLRIPMISLLDCPGGDPRPDESDRDSVMKMLDLSHQMIDYPFGKMGVITSRCYGGAGMFAFPRIFGSQKLIAFEDCRIGIIGEQIIEKVIQNSPRLKDEWQKTASTQTADLKDLVDSNNVDQVVKSSELGAQVREFLAILYPEKRETRVRPMTLRKGTILKTKKAQTR